MGKNNKDREDEHDDELFSMDVDWWHNACLDPFHADWYVYIEGYKRAAKVLVEQVKKNRSDLDVLVYPIVFLYRQYMELLLKSIISNGRKLLDQSGEFPKHHRLDKLWVEARRILEEVYKGDPREELDEIQDYINQFCGKDPIGSAFRYPTNLEGKKSLPGLTHINIRKFSDIVEKAAFLIEGASMGIDEYLAWKMEMESEYRHGYY
ncbi:MAG TPA: hypothetical protein VMW72_10270 [Sedimentisphaerales bacterium]|nr:hypothetical protein [Sedimentisphaerales bacterium]